MPMPACSCSSSLCATLRFFLPPSPPDHGLELFSEYLGANTTCKTLDVGHNGITDAGVESLVEALKTNETLTDLDLSGNKITHVGFDLLARGLADTAVTRLVVGSMDPGEEGLVSLAEALKTNDTLVELDLEDTIITDGARAKLIEMLVVNHKITITGVDPPIERPPPVKPAETEPEPEAEPEPEPEPELLTKVTSKKKHIRPPPPKFDEQGNIIKNFADPNLLDDGKLDGPAKGDGFMGMLSMWRDTEVLVERQEEMDEVDPRERERLRKEWEDKDKKKWNPRGGSDVSEGVPPSSSAAGNAKSSQTFGVRIEDLEMITTEEGQRVPKVLHVLKNQIGVASVPKVFLKQADDSFKASARAKLDVCDWVGFADDGGADSLIAANLLLDWFGEYPGELLNHGTFAHSHTTFAKTDCLHGMVRHTWSIGGVLASLSAEAQQNMDEQEGALSTLEQLPEALQVPFIAEQNAPV
jgi:hypothetical protein